MLFSSVRHLRGMPVWVRYAVTTVLVLSAFLIRHSIGEMLQGYPFLLFFPVIILCGLIFDRGTGIYSVVLSAALAVYFLMPPVGSFELAEPGQWLAVALFVGIGLMIAALVESLHVAFEQLAAAREALDAKNLELAASAEQKEVLLRELFHRVRNDLLTMSALVQLQVGHVQDPQAREALAALTGRIQVLTRVHTRLNLDNERAVVDSRDFIGGLCDDLRDGVLGLRPVGLQTQLESHPLPLARAVPIGLVINELVTNSLKYAFPDEREGTIRVSFRRDGEDFLLEVTDTGIGLDGTTRGSGMGHRLVRSLASQLDGHFELADPGTGTCCTLRFPAG